MYRLEEDVTDTLIAEMVPMKKVVQLLLLLPPLPHKPLFHAHLLNFNVSMVIVFLKYVDAINIPIVGIEVTNTIVIVSILIAYEIKISLDPE